MRHRLKEYPRRLTRFLAAVLLGVCATRPDLLAFTLTYDELGITNGAPIPSPYPGVPAATVTHQAVSNGVPLVGVFFWGDVSPGNGYGDLTNVAVGPHGPDVFAGVTITPHYPSNHVRLISFDIATKDDDSGDLSFTIYVQDTDNFILDSPFVNVAGDENNTTHTHVDFSGTPIDGPLDKGLSVFWPASDGRVAVDNIQFEIIGPVILPNDAPVATSFTAETLEDAAMDLLLLGSDADGPVTFAILTAPTNGSLSSLDTSTGTLSYTPNTNYHGPDAFMFGVSDGTLTATGMISVTVMPVNDVPVATSFETQTLEDTSVELKLLGDDVESPVTFAIVVGPSHGVLSELDSDTGFVRYTPVANYHGPDAFTFAVNDGTLFATGSVSIVVESVNDAPVATNVVAETLENVSINLSLAGGDIEGAAVFGIAQGPTNGMLTNPNINTGTVNYTPFTDYAGPDAFTFFITDGALFATGSVRVTVIPALLGFHGGVEVAGNLALAPDASRYLAAYNLGAGTNTSQSWTHMDAGRARRVVMRGRYAFVAGGPEGMIMIDLTDPDLSVAEAQFLTDGDCVDVVVSDNTAYVADVEIGVIAVDVTYPPYFPSISVVSSNRSVLGLDIVSNLLYVAAGPAGLQIYDVNDPLNPILKANVVTTGSASRLRVQGSFGYVVCGDTRLEIYNIQNPQTPTLSGSYTTTAGSVADLDVSGDHVFLANTNGTLAMLSVSNSASPLLLTNYTVSGGATGVRVVGNVAYVRDLAGQLAAVELSGIAPAPPRLLRPIEDVIGLMGQEAVLSADVEGSLPLTYHWHKDGTPLMAEDRINGVTSPFLKIQGLLGTDAGVYSVVVTNAFGQVVSSNALLTLVVPGTPQNEGHLEPEGFTAGVWMDGRFAYTATGEKGLQVFNVSNPHFPLFAGYFDTDGETTMIETLGNHAFVAAGSAGIQIFVLNNLPIIVPAGSYDTPGTALGLNVVAGNLYVADGEAGLRIIDISEPTQPIELGGCDTFGTAYSVRTIGSLAYVADGAAGLRIINVTNPANPFVIGGFDTDGTAYRVEVVDNRAFVADGTNGLVILDVSNPIAPTLLGHYLTAGPAMAIVVADTMALLAEGTAGLEVVNISNPTNIFHLAGVGNLGEATDVKLVGNTVSVACGTNGVRLFSLFGISPPAPEIVSSSGDQYLLPGQSTILQIAVTGVAPLRYQWFRNGQPLFASSNRLGVISNTLQLTNLTLTDSGEYSLAVWNAWNMVAAASVNLHVVPFGTPVPRTNYYTDSDLLDIRVSGQLAYVASRQGGLEVFDFRDLTNPNLVGSLPTLGFGQHLHVRGHLAYVAAWTSGLEIFDVAQPTSLMRIGHCDTSGLALGVYVADNLAYVADHTNGLQIIDVRDPSRPFLVARATTRGPALKVQVRANKAYVATSGAGLEIFDVSNPLGMVRLGWIDTPGEAVNVELLGPYAYVSDYDRGIQIIDVSNPFAPLWVGEFLAQADIFHVQVVSNLAYVAKGVAGLDVMDASNPVFPALALAGKAGASVYAVEVSGKHAFLADRESGFVIAELLGLPPSPPQLTESPESTAKTAGSNLVLSVSVRGTPPFDYQWYKNGTELSADDKVQGVGDPHLRINNLTAPDAAGYFAVVSSAYGAVTSAVANVTVSMGTLLVAPAFIIHPVGKTASLGGSVAFQASASGSAPLIRRWHFNGEPLFEGGHYSGVTTDALLVTNIALLQDGMYQLKAWNSAGLAVSQPATLTFIGPLQDQINSLPTGSVVSLPAAAYEEKLVIIKDLTLAGAGPGATILDALGRGTPITISNGANVTLSGLTIRNGRSPANERGGAIKNLGNLLLQNCELTNNVADFGGSIANLQGAKVISSVILHNQATVAGGGVYNGVNAEFEITDSTIEGNVASLGGGIFNAGDLFATNCTVAANRAAGTFEAGLGYGGGIYSTGTGWVVNCTISGNEAVVPPLSPAGGVAGALFAPKGTFEFRSTTLAFNFASTAAGGVLAGPNSELRAGNTIFAGSFTGDDASDFDGLLQSTGFNLLQSPAAAEIIGETSNNVLGVDPRLGPLQANGGITHTHALRSGSPAIDAADCGDLAKDQRGLPRPFDIPVATNQSGGCDIGAFEYTSAAPVIGLITNLVTDEDLQVVLPFFADDLETPDGLVFNGVSDKEQLVPSANIVVDGIPGNRTLIIKPGTNQFGTASIYISVTDADGFTNDVYFDLMVQPVNDAPVIAGFTNSIVGAPVTQYVFPFTVSDVDTLIEAITLQVHSSNPAVIDPAMIAVLGNRMNRQLNLAHVPGAIGVTTINVIASDGVTETTNEFIIEVRAIELSLAGLSIDDKEYDGRTTATVGTYGTLTGVWPGHNVTLDTTVAVAIFDTPNVGAGKPVTVTGLVLSGNDAGSYTITDQTATAAILTKPIIVMANDKVRAFGQTNPVFALTYSGFVVGDDEETLDKKPTAVTEATIASPAGNYPITVVGGLDENYELIRVDGTLTITNVPPVILSLTRAGTGNIVIIWSSISNQVYRLHYTDDLRTTNWINQPPDITALGPSAIATNIAGTATQRYYRVSFLP